MSDVQDDHGGLNKEVRQTQVKLPLRIKLIVRPPSGKVDKATTTAQRDGQLRRSSRSRVQTPKAKEQETDVRGDKKCSTRKRNSQNGRRQLASRKIVTSTSAADSQVNSMKGALEERSVHTSSTDEPADTTHSPTTSAVASSSFTLQDPAPYAYFGSAPQATFLDLLAIAAEVSQDEVDRKVARNNNVYIGAQTNYFATKIGKSEDPSKLRLVNNSTNTYSGTLSNQLISKYMDIDGSLEDSLSNTKASLTPASASAKSIMRHGKSKDAVGPHPAAGKD